MEVPAEREMTGMTGLDMEGGYQGQTRVPEGATCIKALGPWSPQRHSKTQRAGDAEKVPEPPDCGLYNEHLNEESPSNNAEDCCRATRTGSP